jgi:DNA recombination protein RmuC
MSEVLFQIGSRPVTATELLLTLLLVALVLLVAVAIGLFRAARGRAAEADDQAMRAEGLEQRVAELVRAQSEASGRMQTLAEILGGRQAELARVVTERLDTVSHRLGEGMVNSTRATTESLSQLHERIAVVDAAQLLVGQKQNGANGHGGEIGRRLQRVKWALAARP